MGMFTAEELEELRKFDAEVDEADLTYEDYLLEDLVEDILFPEKAEERERRHEYRKAKREKVPVAERKRREKEAYAKRDKEAEKARKREWYRKNKERILLQQKDYRERTGRTKQKKAG